MANDPEKALAMIKPHMEAMEADRKQELARIAQEKADAYQERMARIAESQGRQYGAPIYTQDESGKVHAWQTSTSGDAKEVALPEGHKLIDKATAFSGIGPVGVPQQLPDGSKSDPFSVPLQNPAQESIAQQIANGEMKYPSGVSLKDKGMQSVLARAKALNPDIDETVYPTKQKAEQYWTTGQGAIKLKSTNAVLNHADVVESLIDQLKNGGIPAANALANRIASETGDTRISSFKTAMNIYGPELVNSIVPAGGGEAEREEARKALVDLNGTTDQQKAAINTIRRLQAGQLVAVKQQMDSAYPKTPRNPSGGANLNRFLSAAAQRVLKEHESTMNTHDEALDWAKSHPDDPRAARILKLHGM